MAVVVQVVAAAIVASGRLLAARRSRPADLAGGWELPGGKVEPGERPEEAVVREVREELGCGVRVLRRLDGQALIRPGYTMTAYLADLVDGEPIPGEHDAVRWLAPEELGDVEWLPAERPFLGELSTLLAAGERLHGGNVGGAVRIGRTVRRGTGTWTPAVHALLDRLRSVGMVDVPQVLGFDEHGREVLTYLAGRVPASDTELAPPELLADAMRWLRRFHTAIADFDHPGPWRNPAQVVAGTEPVEPTERLICHHDFAAYNVAVSSSSTGERVVGVFDWDMAGPGTRVEDLGFAAWNWVPMYRPLPAQVTADRLAVMASAYADPEIRAADIATAVVPRIERSVRVITAGQLAGDEGMLNLARIGEPELTGRALEDLRLRLPAILAALA